MTDVDWDRLRAAAQACALSAHAPYSRFQVGAALLGADGELHAGCNVENASYGLSICAERNAVFSAVARGARKFVAIAVVSSAAQPITPCGACRQVLFEFPPAFAVRCYGQDGNVLELTTAELLPHAFRAEDFAGSS
jgi:cytidine deaminase